MASAQACSGVTSTKSRLLDSPPELRQSYDVSNSVWLTEAFAIREEPDWVDDAPMQLRRRGRVRVQVVAVRRLTFSPVGDEFGTDDD